MRDAQSEIAKLLAWIIRKRGEEKSERPVSKVSKPDEQKNLTHQYTGRRRYFNNSELIEKARSAKNGWKFRSLFDCGDISSYRSHSEADLALISILLYWTNGDEDRVHELFTQSALYRPKWDRFDYRQHCFAYLKGCGSA
jgi:primase-polymerase (primpol)-like protein